MTDEGKKDNDLVDIRVTLNLLREIQSIINNNKDYISNRVRQLREFMECYLNLSSPPKYKDETVIKFNKIKDKISENFFSNKILINSLWDDCARNAIWEENNDNQNL